MSKAKFTKGQWELQGDSIGVMDKTDSQSCGMMNGICHVDMFEFGEITGKANGHLIVAAPEMYELLEYIKQYHCTDKELLNEIIQLQEKARGEQ